MTNKSSIRPVSSMTALFAVLLATLLAALALPLGGCSQPVGTTQQTGGEEPSIPTTGLTKAETVENIEMDKTTVGLTKEKVNNNIANIRIKLANQSKFIGGQYENLAQQLQSRDTTDPSIADAINFANFVKDMEDTNAFFISMGSGVAGAEVGTTGKYGVGKNIDNLTTQICDLIGSGTQPARLFRAQMDAYRELTYADERGGAPADLVALNAKITSLGGAALPEKNAAGELRKRLAGSMPPATGKFAPNLLTQIEDHAQFDAWTDKLHIMGYAYYGQPLSAPKSNNKINFDLQNNVITAGK